MQVLQGGCELLYDLENFTVINYAFGARMQQVEDRAARGILCDHEVMATIVKADSKV